VTGEDSWVPLPLGTDKVVWREPAQGLEALGVIVSQSLHFNRPASRNAALISRMAEYAEAEAQ
jgi:hypothetical protein